MEPDKKLIRTLLIAGIAEVVLISGAFLIANTDLKVVLILLFAGALGGMACFFTSYIELPTPNGIKGVVFVRMKPALTWQVALIGYTMLGIVGAVLTPLINALVSGLPGLEDTITASSVLLGYGVLFGFFAVKLLVRAFAIAIPEQQKKE